MYLCVVLCVFVCCVVCVGVFVCCVECVCVLCCVVCVYIYIGSNLGSLDLESDALPIGPPRHLCCNSRLSGSSQAMVFKLGMTVECLFP